MMTEDDDVRCVCNRMDTLKMTLLPVARFKWPSEYKHAANSPTHVWVSKQYLVQQYPAPAPAICRLSVCRTGIRNGQWADGIKWDELQLLKRQAGFGDSWAVEVFPPDGQVINVANFRHLWVLPEAPAYAWRKV